VISVISNVIPTAVSDVCRLWFDGKPRLSAAKATKFHGLSRALFSDTNPVPVKTAMSLMGYCADEMRMPLCEMDDKNLEILKASLKKHSLI
jgi:4-hydroxy-tetrahydrodipicolinate synthase